MIAATINYFVQQICSLSLVLGICCTQNQGVNDKTVQPLRHHLNTTFVNVFESIQSKNTTIA